MLGADLREMTEQQPLPPIACSLGPGELEPRLQEFRALFSSGLLGIDRRPRRLSLTLDLDGASEFAVRDLLRREHECCPFFAFDVRIAHGRIQIDMEVPEAAEAALDDFERLARSAARS